MSDYAFMKTGLVGEVGDGGIDADRLIDLLRVMVDQTWEIATRAVRHHGWRRPTPVEVPDVHAALKYQARFFLANMERGAKFEDEAEERSDDEAERNEAERSAASDDERSDDEIEWNEIEGGERGDEADPDPPTCCPCDLCVAVNRASAEWATWEPADEIEAFLKTSVDAFIKNHGLR